ncbi:class I SAM-dependent methyltransferase, partial [Georgenia sp. MJ170]|uniref:class I SAM-dependent methyltransferase n=1 Tax=Georgenia sunbinii TaxID=3117728 RepID=UPI002F267B9B
MTTLPTKFATKVIPDGDKLRGGYYTPQPLARFVAAWVAEAGPKVLEPSCGDGAILQHLADMGTPTGIELLSSEATKASAVSGVDVVNDDFFSWFSKSKHETFDGVAGNPPYIRYGSWGEVYRDGAFELMRAEGFKPTRLTNAWLPFVVAALVAARDGGRIGLVLPAELLQVGYAAPLRA